MNSNELQVAKSIYVIGCSEWNGIRALSRSTGSANVFLIDGGSEMALFDCGATAGVPDLFSNIQSLGLEIRKIRKIFLTHSHWDHVHGLAEILKTLDCTVYGHELARESLAGKTGIYLPDYRYPPSPIAPVHELLKDGDTIPVGNLQLRVMETPGHTPDGLAFAFELPDGHGLGCVSGDTAIGDQAGAKGVIGWIDPRWNSKLSSYKSSLERIRALHAAALFPGHGFAHVGNEKVQTSVDNCLWRLDLLMSIPHLGTMLALQC